MSDCSVEDRGSRSDRGTAADRELVQKSRRGGRRPGAGRKRSRYRSDSPHRTRPYLSSRHPVHVVYRMNCWVAELRTRGLFHVFRKVLAFYLACSDFRVVHISIQKNHLHLLVEASDRGALRRGLTSFASRAARALNRSLGTSGKIFKHRYHATQITTPRQARNSLAYVLNNWRRHNLDITKAGQISYPIDLYSSALAFTGWSTRVAPRLPAEYVPLPVSPPKTDLLRWDYRRYGLIDPFETPGPIW